MLLVKKVLWFVLIFFILAIIIAGIYFIISSNASTLTDKGVFV